MAYRQLKGTLSETDLCLINEIEVRLAALEGLLVERLAMDEPHRLAQQLFAAKTWPAGRKRAQAIMITEDAIRRFDEIEVGRLAKR